MINLTKFEVTLVVLIIFRHHTPCVECISFKDTLIAKYYNSASDKSDDSNSVGNLHFRDARISENVTSKKSFGEIEFAALRIEYIKNQILKKLRLKEVPKVSFVDLPEPIKEYKHLILPDHTVGGPAQYDDFYGKTSQAIVFLYQEDARCLKQVKFSSACLPFKMPSGIRSAEVSKAELWLYRNLDSTSNANHSFIISEVAHWDSDKSFQKNKPIAIQETELKDGWLKVEVSHIVKNWLRFQDSTTHALNLVCKTCQSKSPISFSNKYKPFLVISTYNYHMGMYAEQHRKKRSTECSLSSTECCREKLYVSFADIGWNDWIIRPEGYDAYFCRGSCTAPTAILYSANHHSSILQKIISKKSQLGSRPELSSCCAATQFQPLQLVYMNEDKSITTKFLSNMIVDTCECM